MADIAARPALLRLWPDPILTRPCNPVAADDPDLHALIDDLFATMYAQGGRGLAAPQIGVLKRVFVVDITWKDGPRTPRVFINPEGKAKGRESVTADEQCLSIPGLPMAVDRPAQFDLSWRDRDGTPARATLDGPLARCVQHELDHLNGIVIFDHQTPAARADLENRYAA